MIKKKGNKIMSPMREKKISNKRFSMLPYQVTAFDIGTASADGCTDSSGVLEYRSIAETNQSSFRHLITLILHRDLSEGLASLWQIPRGFRGEGPPRPQTVGFRPLREGLGLL